MAKPKSQRKIIAQSANRKHIEFMPEPRIPRDTAAHNPERSQHQMQRSADRLLKIILIRDFVSQIGKRSKRVDEFITTLSDTFEIGLFKVLYFQFVNFDSRLHVYSPRACRRVRRCLHLHQRKQLLHPHLPPNRSRRAGSKRRCC